MVIVVDYVQLTEQELAGALAVADEAAKLVSLLRTFGGITELQAFKDKIDTTVGYIDQLIVIRTIMLDIKNSLP